MKNQLENLRRKATVAALGGALLAPLMGSVPAAQAAPPHPEWHYNNQRNQNQILTATVIRDLSGRDRFTVRFDSGRTAEVISRRNEPTRISRGDRIELRGDFERGLFIADSVRILRNEGPRGNQNQSTIRGRVSRDYYGRDFEVRTDNGRSVTVRSLRGEPYRLSKNDRVELRGRYDRGLFLASDVDILRNR